MAFLSFSFLICNLGPAGLTAEMTDVCWNQPGQAVVAAPENPWLLSLEQTSCALVHLRSLWPPRPGPRSRRREQRITTAF